MYLNKAIIIGNLTRDPELKALPSGVKVCAFSVATNRTWKDKEGKKQEAVEFHNLVAFSRTAELVGQYLKKGSQVLVEGRIQTRNWESDGKKMYRTEIVAETVQFGAKPTTKPVARQEDGVDPLPPEEGPQDVGADEIPF